MKKFIEDYCPLEDNFDLWLDVAFMANPTLWGYLDYADDLKVKMDEEVSTTEIAPRGTHRRTTRATRRKATAKAKQHRAEIIIIRKAKARRTWDDVCRHPWEFYGKNIDKLMGEVVVR